VNKGMTETNASMRLRVRAVAGLVLATLTGCAQLPAERGRLALVEELGGRGGMVELAAAGPGTLDDDLRAMLDEPLSADAAVQIAWRLSPTVKSALAQLGMASADLFEAQRPHNPSLSIGRIGSGAAREISYGLHLPLGDLLLLPARREMGALQWQAAVAETVAQLQAEATAVRRDYYNYQAASQVAAMRDAVAEASALSAELAQRFYNAGNISALKLAREQAHASLTRNAAATARGDRLAARMKLAERLGLAGRSNRWSLPEQLALPPTGQWDVSELLSQARSQRADLRAARLQLEAAASGQRLARGSRWFGGLELELEHEREDDDQRNGAGLALELPLFSQGQAGIGRADARHELALQRIEAMELSIERELRVGTARLATLAEIIESYQGALIPQQQDIVARELERYNFMLIGVFELLEARKAQFDTYQQYFEAIRDYWISRAELEQALGGPLPGPAAERLTPTIDEIVRPEGDSAHDHHHGHH
jgi:outer membrane protein, heavy metal efflux system